MYRGHALFLARAGAASPVPYRRANAPTFCRKDSDVPFSDRTMFEKFYKYYFSINLSDYIEGVNFPICQVLLFVALGLCVACFAVSYRKSTVYRLISGLLRREAIGEEKAVILASLGLDRSRPVRHLLLSAPRQVASMVGRVGEVHYTYEEYRALSRAKKIPAASLDPDSDLFYIRPDALDRARLVYERGATSLLKALICCVGILIFYFLLVLCMPSILSFLQSVSQAIVGKS